MIHLDEVGPEDVASGESAVHIADGEEAGHSRHTARRLPRVHHRLEDLVIRLQLPYFDLSKMDQSWSKPTLLKANASVFCTLPHTSNWSRFKKAEMTSELSI